MFFPAAISFFAFEPVPPLKIQSELFMLNIALRILQKHNHRQRRYLELSSLSVDLMSKVGMWVRWDSDVPTKHVKSLVKKQAFLKKGMISREKDMF
jgi:hypothetical protein